MGNVFPLFCLKKYIWAIFFTAFVLQVSTGRNDYRKL
jgi:hypothetical protein